ncbi:MAG: hypothetical protein JO199_08195, partial [Candidatus Eremiobacteraeota bacterium]|nr:hypothetical protein [Candidatus Eremiobacteraeota bacterium]
SIENKLVRTSTLATFVGVTIHPDQWVPRRTSRLEKRIATISGGAALGRSGTVSVNGAEPIDVSGGSPGACAAHAPTTHANAAHPSATAVEDRAA